MPVDQKSSFLMRQAAMAKLAGRVLAKLSAGTRTQALQRIADAIEKSATDILFRNEIDVQAATEAQLAPALIDRLTLKEERISEMAGGVREIAAQEDPVGEILQSWQRPNGIQIEKVRVPLGVIGMIYESRPNVTVDAAALCLRSGNAVILKGGSEAIQSNTALVKAIGEAATKAGVPEGAIQLITDTSRQSTLELVRLTGLVDLVIARGSEEMIHTVSENATVPVLGHGKGVCHVYVDKSADLAKAERIAYNAKVQRPGTCNAMETLLVHKAVASDFLPRMAQAFQTAKVELRGDEKARAVVPSLRPAMEEDWRTEYLDLVLSIKVVDSEEEAIHHINRYGSGHSDSIVAEDREAAERFLKEVDSSAVFHNASTRLHDGGVFGLGAEIGISTRKLHARGTMGARELTTTKYVVRGTGQIRE